MLIYQAPQKKDERINVQLHDNYMLNRNYLDNLWKYLLKSKQNPDSAGQVSFVNIESVVSAPR